MHKRLLATIIIVVAALAAASGAYLHFARTGAPAPAYATSAESDVYVRFDMEAYDTILANYWNKGADGDLAELFRLSLSKTLGTDQTLASSTRSGAADMLLKAFDAATSTAAKQQLAANTLIVALYNLAPQGRSGLYSQAQVTQLRQEVANVNPSTDLYKNLGLAEGASQKDIDAAYQQKTQELKNATSTEAQDELKQVAYAHQVLSNDATKANYDQGHIEPTVFPHTLGKTLYLYFDKISPTTLQEFGNALENASTTPFDSLILDFRGNIGGALDFTQAFMGLFVGQNQYAFDLYHQGDYQAQRTTLPKLAELVRFKDIAILTDAMTQSTAELTTAAFKRYHLAHVVGATTRGWGTVENTYPLSTVIDPNTSYSLLLVNSITLRDDNQPIEGRGVDPDVSIADANWKNELSPYFTSSSLIAALKQEAANAPLK